MLKELQEIELEIMADNLQALKMFVDIIPNFNGNSAQLTKFINLCDDLISTFSIPNNTTRQKYLIAAISSKLVGQAQTALNNRLEINTWEQIKDLLNKSFGDPRDLECSVQELIHLRINFKESLQTFADRVQTLRSLIMSKLQSADMPTNQKQGLALSYNLLALNTFVANLPEKYEIMIRTNHVDSLEDAINIVRREEQFSLYKQSLKNSTNQIQNNKTHNTQFYKQPTFRQPNAPPFFSNTRSQFPSQPINIQPNPSNQPQRFFTNQQVFGKPQNIFKPNNNTATFSKPTPMSGVSTIPNSRFQKQSFPENHQRPNFSNNRNIFQPQRSPNHMTQELHNQELDSTSQEYSDIYPNEDENEPQDFIQNPIDYTSEQPENEYLFQEWYKDSPSSSENFPNTSQTNNQT